VFWRQDICCLVKVLASLFLE
jgi:hypothetical protein